MENRVYHTKMVLSTPISDLLTEARTGKKNYKRVFFNFLRRTRCLFLGHQTVTGIWRNKENSNWIKEKDYKLHTGCRRCPKFKIEKP